MNIRLLALLCPIFCTLYLANAVSGVDVDDPAPLGEKYRGAINNIEKMNRRGMKYRDILKDQYGDMGNDDDNEDAPLRKAPPVIVQRATAPTVTNVNYRSLRPDMTFADTLHYNILHTDNEAMLIEEAISGAKRGKNSDKWTTEVHISAPVAEMQIAQEKPDYTVLRLGYMLYQSPSLWSVAIDGDRYHPKKMSGSYFRIINIGSDYVKLRVWPKMNNDIMEMYKVAIANHQVPQKRVFVAKDGAIEVTMHYGECMDFTRLSISNLCRDDSEDNDGMKRKVVDPDVAPAPRVQGVVSPGKASDGL